MENFQFNLLCFTHYFIISFISIYENLIVSLEEHVGESNCTFLVSTKPNISVTVQ